MYVRDFDGLVGGLGWVGGWAYLHVNANHIPIFHQGQGSSLGRFRRHVSHHNPVRRTGKPSVCHESDVFPQPCTYQGGTGGELLGHAC